MAGTVVALALIAVAIAFSITAGVDPEVGLYASFCIALVTAFASGRPAMISAATGAMALVMITLVKEHGVGYLFAATILTGLLQIGAGALRLGHLMRFVSRSVVTGFVNALAILICLARMPELIGQGTTVYVMTAVGLGIIDALPYLTKAAPSSRSSCSRPCRCISASTSERSATWAPCPTSCPGPRCRRFPSRSRRCGSSCPMP